MQQSKETQTSHDCAQVTTLKTQLFCHMCKGAVLVTKKENALDVMATNTGKIDDEEVKQIAQEKQENRAEIRICHFSEKINGYDALKKQIERIQEDLQLPSLSVFITLCGGVVVPIAIYVFWGLAFNK